jgi:hypothetical protein
MPNPRVCLRLPERLWRLIDRQRGGMTLSAWLRDAASHRIAIESGINPALVSALADHNRQLRGLGINLNQLAQRANEGRPVVLPQQLLEEIDARIRESRLVLSELKTRLPE